MYLIAYIHNVNVDKLLFFFFFFLILILNNIALHIPSNTFFVLFKMKIIFKGLVINKIRRDPY